MNVRLIRKLRLKKGCKYLLFLPKESILREDAENLIEMLKDRGWSDSLIVAINDPSEIKVIEKDKYDLDEKMICKKCGNEFYRWRYYKCPKCGEGH